MNIRDHFPQLKEKVGDYDFTYLDSAATTLKPQNVIDRITHYYSKEVSNVHRGAHYFSNKATESYEHTRVRVADFIHAQANEIIFTYGTTDSVNLVSYAIEDLLKKTPHKNEIVLTEMEHHSNIVPWYFLAKRLGLKIKTIPFLSSGELDLSQLSEVITDQTFLVSVVHMSNTLGVINPLHEIIAEAKQKGAYTFIDAAQSISYLPISVQDLDCDFLAFSSHKIFGPEGLGFLYGKEELLNEMGYYRGGGSMISNVTFSDITFLPSPQKYEAGTPNIGAVIAFSEALNFFESLNYQEIHQHEKKLLKLCYEELKTMSGFQLHGDIDLKENILSFSFEGIHPADLGSLLDQMGVAVRVGHHCTQPIMRGLGISASVRASFSVYNDERDCLRFIESIKKSKEMLDG